MNTSKHAFIILCILFYGHMLCGQIIVTKKDTIPIGTDSLANFILPNFRGTAVWQQSLDTINWVNLNVQNIDTLTVPLNLESLFRAKINEGSCNPVFTDTVQILLADSIKYLGPHFEEAYPDSTGKIITGLFGSDTITCALINGDYVYQGDIILTKEQFNEGFSKGASISELVKKWPFKTVYYELRGMHLFPERITKAIKYWEQKTTLKFIERTDHKNFIKFIYDDIECSSYLGMVSMTDGQPIKIPLWAHEGHVIHEIGHAVGLIHEHARNDRDLYINVDTANVIEGKKHNYYKRDSSINLGRFDFNSIMLYSSYSQSFAIDKTKPIITKLNGSPFDAQRSYLSRGDIAMVEFLYNKTSGTFIDDRDDREYKWVLLGENYWMAENLAFIPEDVGTVKCKSNNSSENEAIYQESYYTVYDNYGVAARNTPNYEKYGVLYNWHAASNSCPTGWHTPSRDEWENLEDYIYQQHGGELVFMENDWSYMTNVGKFLKSTQGWYNEGNGSNYYLFNALPAGGRAGCDAFYGLTAHAYWWTSTEIALDKSYCKRISYDNHNIYTFPYNKHMFSSVRCIKD